MKNLRPMPKECGMKSSGKVLGRMGNLGGFILFLEPHYDSIKRGVLLSGVAFLASGGWVCFYGAFACDK